MAISPLSLIGAVGSSLIGTDTLFKTTNDRSYISTEVTIIAPCIISEKHQDAYVITEHPTEMGVLISDHMYALPKVVEVEIAYSMSGGINALKMAGSLVGATQAPLSLQDYYAKFRKLQDDRIPFEITTGKRRYSDMLIENISETTEATTENMLMLQLRCKQILMVSSKTTTNAKNQSNAANTAEPVNKGVQQSTPATTYALPPQTTITETLI